MEDKFRIGSFAVWLAFSAGCSSEGSDFQRAAGGANSSGGSGNGGSSGAGVSAGGANSGGASGTSASGGNVSSGGSTAGGGGDGGGVSSGGAGGTGAGGSAGTDAGGSAGTTPVEPCPKPAGEICHEFFANDNARNQINYVNEFDPTKNWTVPVNVTSVNSPRQVEMVDNSESSNGKAIMVSVNTGYQEYDMLTGDRLVNVVLAGTTGIRGAVRLPDGNTALGVGDNQLRVVDAAGTTVRQCTLPGAGGDSLRVINRDSATGNLLYGRFLELFIVSDQCQELYKAQLPGGSKAYSVFPRDGGGVWATSGAPSTVLEYDGGGQIVSQVGGKDAHPGVGLDFFSGFERMPNGNVVAANWQGHIANPVDSTPHLVEFTPANELVWQWGNQTVARQITNTLMLR